MYVMSVIKRKAIEPLKAHGFIYSGKGDSASWVFSRIKNDVTQSMIFQKSNLSRKLKIILSTSVNNGRLIEGDMFDEESNKYWWEYNNEHELEEVISKLVDILIQYGIPFLDLMSIPDIKPPVEMAKELMIDTRKKADLFCEKYDLGYSDVNNSLDKLQKILREHKNLSFEEMWETLINAAAYIGELIKEFHNGDWVWKDEYNILLLENIGGTRYKISCLSWAIDYWNNPDMKIFGLVWRYKELVDTLKLL